MESGLVSRSSNLSADPLSAVLSLLRPQGYMAGGIDAGGAWAFEFSADELCRCFAIVSGGCRLRLSGGEPIELMAGDFVVLPHGSAFQLASDPAAPSIDILSVIRAPLTGHILTWQGGGACLALSVLFSFAGSFARVLLTQLPATVHIQDPADRAVLRWYLERMMGVLREQQPGRVLLGEHLAQMMLIEVLRLHVRQQGAMGIGWLHALADAPLSAAITAMHASPGLRWTLRQMAQCAGLSRSAFAQRFKERVGMSALGYLTQWRMLLAADRLIHSQDSVALIANSLGYESESSFGFAFKREMGCAPRQYGEARRATLGGRSHGTA